MKNRMRTLACVMALSLSGIAFAAQQAAGAGSQGKKNGNRTAEIAQEFANSKLEKLKKDMLDNFKVMEFKKLKFATKDFSILKSYFEKNFKNEFAFIDDGKHLKEYGRLFRELMFSELMTMQLSALKNVEKYKEYAKLAWIKELEDRTAKAKKALEPFDQKHKLFMQPKEKSAAQLKHEEEMRVAAERKAKEKAERAQKHKELEAKAQAEKARRQAEKDALKKAQAEEDARKKQEREALQEEVELLRKCRQQQVDDFEKERREKLAQIQAEVEASGTAALLAAEQAKREEAEAAHAKLVKRIEGLRGQLANKSQEIDKLGQQAVANTAQALQEREALQSKLQAEKTALMQDIADMDTQIEEGWAFYKRAKRREHLLKSANAQLQQATVAQADMLAIQGNALAVHVATLQQQQQQLAQFKPVAAVKDGVVVPVYVAPAHAYVVPPVNALMAPTSK